MSERQESLINKYAEEEKMLVDGKVIKVRLNFLRDLENDITNSKATLTSIQYDIDNLEQRKLEVDKELIAYKNNKLSEINEEIKMKYEEEYIEL